MRHMTYIGSLTIPFRDFSCASEVQCEERGTTGSREAILAERRLATGTCPISGAGWNLDNARFDMEFPQYRVSRVRQWPQRVAESVAIDSGIKGLPGFGLLEVPNGGHDV